MHFGYSTEQQEIRDLARKIFTDNVTPESLKALEQENPETGACHDPEVWQHLASTGLLGLALDTQYGGMGMGFIELCLLYEEAGKVLAPVPLLQSTLAALTLQKFAPGHYSDTLSLLGNGQSIAAIALAEGNQFDFTQVATKAEAHGDGWVLSGEKTCVAYIEAADTVLVSAATDQGAQLFCVDLTESGVSIAPQSSTTGRSSSLLALREAPASLIPGGTEAVIYLGQRLACALCWFQVGCSDTALSMTAAYVAEREQFGVKIGTFQAVGHRAANCFIDISCLRLVTLQASSLLNEERDATSAVEIAKCWAGDVSHRVSYACQHLHGGIGVDRDYALWRYATHSKECELSLGSSGFLLSQLGKRIAQGHFDIE